MAAKVSAVIPTLGRSPYLADCLLALRRAGGDELEIVVVDQAESPLELPAEARARVLRPGANLGFSRANNLGIEASRGDFVAAVNDDALVEEGWLAPLVAALESDETLGAVQGVHLILDHESQMDGCGLTWNRWWQAVQIGRFESPPAPGRPPFETFGVSATAGLYRRSALESVAPKGEVFDPLLVTYYEDVDLAVRLRTAGYRALCVPAARARHAGSVTSLTLGSERWSLLYGNRYLIVAKLLGRGFWLRLPLLVARDLLDLARALFEPGGEHWRGIVRGWMRALRFLPQTAHTGPSVFRLIVLRGDRSSGRHQGRQGIR
jgi:GT2 family glycosyltransferase